MKSRFKLVLEMSICKSIALKYTPPPYVRSVGLILMLSVLPLKKSRFLPDHFNSIFHLNCDFWLELED